MKEIPVPESPRSMVEALKNLSFFSQLAPRLLDDIFRTSKVRHYERDEVIIPEGSFDHFIYILIAGHVRVMKGSEEISELSEIGDLFGELSIIDSSPRSASVMAVTQTSCMAVDASFLDHLLPGDRHGVHAIIYKLFSEIASTRLRVSSAELAAAREELAIAKKELTRYRR